MEDLAECTTWEKNIPYVCKEACAAHRARVGSGECLELGPSPSLLEGPPLPHCLPPPSFFTRLSKIPPKPNPSILLYGGLRGDRRGVPAASLEAEFPLGLHRFLDF